MTFSQLASILRARWLVGLLVLSFVLGLAVVITLFLPKKFIASAEVILDVKSVDPIAGAFSPVLATAGFMATQVDIIESRRVAVSVVQRLKLTENPELRESWIKEAKGQGNFEAWIAQILQRNLVVKPSRESNVINVSFSGADPKFASALANAFVQAYVDTTLELRVDPAKRYSSFFDDRGKKLRRELEEAQAKLSAFQNTTRIIGSDERIDIETARLSELSSQLVAIQAQATESSIRQGQVKASGDQIQDVLQNPLISGLRGDLTRQQAKLEEAKTKLGSSHPQILELQASVSELSSKIDSEIKRITGGVGVSNRINKQREAEIRSSLEAQREKVLKLKVTRDNLVILQRDVENAQRAYDAVIARGNQTSLESLNQQTNASVLNAATEPTDAASPNKVVNAVLGLFVGTLLALVSMLVAELLDRRVRSVTDLLEFSQINLIGVLPGPEPRRFAFRFRRPSPDHRLLSYQ
jgi:polysaccharide biosynthesis transport protein